MNYPVPHNPYKGKDLSPEMIDQIQQGMNESHAVDPAWLIGDTFVTWCRKHDRYFDDEEAAADFMKGYPGDDITPAQLVTFAEVSMAFPPGARDLTRSQFDHYCGWVQANFPDGVTRKLDEMIASGEYSNPHP